jgi:hypothetical protein
VKLSLHRDQSKQLTHDKQSEIRSWSMRRAKFDSENSCMEQKHKIAAPDHEGRRRGYVHLAPSLGDCAPRMFNNCDGETGCPF